MTKTFRPTWAEVNLGALKYNYNQIQRLVGRDVKLMVVVKANAYGHGLVEVSKALAKMGVDYLGVATVDEALLLRKRRLRKPILVLGSILPDEVGAALKNNISLTLANNELLNIIEKKADSLKTTCRVHIKIDTGMGRIGAWHEDEAELLIDKTISSKSIDVEGVYTHFSSAARDKVYTSYQIESFENLIGKLLNRNFNIPYRHAANSIATVNLKRSHLNLVRPGLIVYGMYPKKGFKRFINLKPVLSLKTKIVYLKNVPPGRSISYGRTYLTQEHTRIATLPIGYADGYGRILSNKAEVLVKGEKAPVVGKVTMDQTMIDVGHIEDVKIGDEVVLIGRQGKNEITTERLARLAGTIPYEIVCSITDRVPRIYKR
ncbi:MAG: alanine racemase [Candidatus Omnitrophica bacterium]|nr:alanine racemase [Candidatus Omnitrophota bacterium]